MERSERVRSVRGAAPAGRIPIRTGHRLGSEISPTPGRDGRLSQDGGASHWDIAERSATQYVNQSMYSLCTESLYAFMTSPWGIRICENSEVFAISSLRSRDMKSKFDIDLSILKIYTSVRFDGRNMMIDGVRIFALLLPICPKATCINIMAVIWSHLSDFRGHHLTQFLRKIIIGFLSSRPTR